MSETIKRLNKTLQHRYGSNLNGDPIFRVVWSDDQLEKRFGVWQEFSGQIFLREIRGLREVPKYSHVKRAWILERWMPPELCFTPEIPSTGQGSHEPVFVFRQESGQAIPVIDEEVYRMIYSLFNPQLPGDRASDLRELERKELAAEIQENVEILTEEGRSWIGHRLHSKEAIIKP